MQQVITKNPALQAIANDPEKLKQRVKLWSENFLLWFFDCVYTKDEGVGEERLAPKFEYIKHLHETIEAERITWVEKSRQQFVTWYMVARYLWKLMYAKDIRLIYGSRVEDDVQDVINSRFKEMYDRLDRAFPIPNLVFRSLSITNPMRGTIMKGMSSSGEGSRGKTGAELWLDEIASQKDQEKTIRASLESINAPGSKVIGVTTPDTEERAQYIKRLIAKSIDKSIPVQIMSRGVEKLYNTQGHCIIRIHYNAHPDKDDAWKEAKIKEIGEVNFSIEHGLNWDIAKGKPAFWGFDLTRHEKRLRFDNYQPLLIGIDPGFGHPSYTMAQKTMQGKCRILHSVTRERTGMTELCQQIEKDIIEKFEGHEDFYFYIDPAGMRKSGQGTENSGDAIAAYFPNYADRIFPAPVTNPNDRALLINNYFQQDMIEVETSCGEYYDWEGNVETGAFVFMLTTGYHLNNQGKVVKDNKWDHFADSFGYMFIQCFYTADQLQQVSKATFQVRPTYYDKLILKPQKPKSSFLPT